MTIEAYPIGTGAATALVNLSAGTTSNNLATVVFSNSNNVSFGLNGSTVTGSIANAQGVTLSRWIQPVQDILTFSVGFNSSVSFQHMILPQYVTATKLALYGEVSLATAANSSSAFFDMTVYAGIYTRTASTLNSLSTVSTATATSWSSNATGSVSGLREFTVPWNMYFTPGEYHVALQISTTNTSATVGTATTALGNTISWHIGASGAHTDVALISMGQSTATSRNYLSGAGISSAFAGGNPASVAVSDIRGDGLSIARAKHILDFRFFD